jgi:hypothetical protein
MLHFAMRTNRQNFAAAQEELKRRGIQYEFQDHEISQSIYFRDPDGHELEITTYDLQGDAPSSPGALTEQRPPKATLYGRSSS